MHAEPQGLQAGFEYFYRFKANGEISPVGRTKTAASGTLSALNFAFASCQQYEHGYFTAYKHMAQDDLDLVIHLGDYIYEYDTNSYTASGGNVRANLNHEIVNLQDYRERHAQYKTDPDLQAAHAAFPWLVTFDDHEVDNNWAANIAEEGMPMDFFARRRRAAFKAYWEHMPLRKAARPTGNGIQIYRRAQYGNLASIHVMDTRQFRSDQACGDGARVNCDDRNNPARTITGAAQEQRLYDGLQASPAKWQILAQQVFMAQVDYTAGAAENLNMDAWDGYLESFAGVTAGTATTSIIRRVSLTGTSSAAYAQFDDHNADGSRATFPLDVEDGDTYGITAAFVRGPNFGVVQVSIDGRKLGAPFDGYAATLQRAEPISLGTVALSEGRHLLSMTVTGKNATAADYLAGLDLQCERERRRHRGADLRRRHRGRRRHRRRRRVEHERRTSLDRG